MPNWLYSGIPHAIFSMLMRLIARTNAIAPMIGGGKVSTKAHDGAPKSACHRDHVRVHAVNCVSGHERCQVQEDPRFVACRNDEVRRL